MNAQENKPTREKNKEAQEAENIISGSAQDDQLEKLKHGKKSKEDNSGASPDAPAQSPDRDDSKNRQ